MKKLLLLLIVPINILFGCSNTVVAEFYRTDAFIYWLNKVKFKKGKNVARLIETPKSPPKKRLDIKVVAF